MSGDVAQSPCARGTSSGIRPAIIATTGRLPDPARIGILNAWAALGAGGIPLGPVRLHLARTPADLAALAGLRAVAFPGDDLADLADLADPRDRSAQAGFQHLLVSARPSGDLLASARLRVLRGPEQICASYTGSFYDLRPVARCYRDVLELGRVCQVQGAGDSIGIWRAMLAGLTLVAQVAQVQFLMGCASFAGADPVRHAAALAYLRRHHIGPEGLRPGRLSSAALDLDAAGPPGQAVTRQAVPELLRLYLGMGAWVSDHAVADPLLDTCHVFLGLDVAVIPAARMRVLRCLVSDLASGCVAGQGAAAGKSVASD